MIKALLIICQIKIIDKIYFAKVILNQNFKAFIIYIIFFTLKLMKIHLF